MIDYYYKQDLSAEPEKCPSCGSRTWYVVKCNSCGTVFCKRCKPKSFAIVEECPEDVMVACDCGDELLLIDW